jgi:predicted component of type VI protein secretion system
MQQSLKKHDPIKIDVRHIHTSLPSVSIEITRGRARQPVRYVDRTTYFIGSGRDCDLVLSDPQFAEVHAYILISNRGVAIRHLGRRPELTLNGRSVRRAQLCDGAVVGMGAYEFTVHIQPPEHPLFESCDAVRAVTRLLDEVAQDKLPKPGGTELSIHRSGQLANEGSTTIAAACGVSVGVPFPGSEPPPWKHFSWQQHVAE